MTTSFARLPIDSIHVHPNNPRRHAVAGQELIDSIKAVGVLQALLVAPDGNQYTLIAGHCRLDALRKAGAESVEAIIRTDLVTEAQQLEAMLVENGRRSDLTPVEEAAGYAQLELFGYKPKDIAHATGVSPATVKARLKLNRLPETSRERLHDGQLTLGDAEALLEFSDEPQVLAQLEGKIGTANFRYAVERARDEREARARNATTILAWEADGIQEVEHPGAWDREAGPCPLSWTSVPKQEDHQGCLAWVKTQHAWSGPMLVCTNPAAHPKPADEAAGRQAAREAEFEAQRAAREAELAAQMAAARVRIDHMVKHFTALYPTKAVTSAQLAALRVTVPLVLATADGSFDPDAYMHAMRIDGTTWWSICGVHADEVAAMTPAKFLKAYAALQAAQVEVLLSDTGDARCAAAWEWLASTGYQLSDVDQALRTEAANSAAA